MAAARYVSDVTIDSHATSDDAIERAIREDTALNDIISKLDNAMAIEADDDLNIPNDDEYYDEDDDDDGTGSSINADSDTVSTSSSFKDFKSTPESSRKNDGGAVTTIKINSKPPNSKNISSSLSHSSSSASSSSSSSFQKPKHNDSNNEHTNENHNNYHLSPLSFSTTSSSSSSTLKTTSSNGKTPTGSGSHTDNQSPKHTDNTSGDNSKKELSSSISSSASGSENKKDKNKDKEKEKHKEGDKKPKSSIRKSLKALKKLTKFADKEEEPKRRMSSRKFSSEFTAVSVDRLPQVFVVKYMGYREVQGMFGLHHVRRPVDEMVKEVKTKIENDPQMELPLLYLVVSPKGLDLREHKHNKVKGGFPTGLISIDFISYGVQDIKFWRVFTCIVVQELSSRTRQASCHAFLCDSSHSGRKLALSLGAAFNVYSKKLQKDGKQHNFQVELRPPDELADAMHAECDA